MSKKSKYTVCALFCGAVIMFLLYFIVGTKKSEYTIIFDSNGGSSINSQIVIENNKVKKPENPTKENYNFVRWEYEDKEYDFNKEVKSNMTLKAIWEENQVQEIYYDIEFVIDGVKKTLSLSKIEENDILSLGFEEKEGFEIKWYVNDQEYDLNTPLTANMTIVGKYVKVTVYTVKFNSDGGNAVNSQKVKPNELVQEPDTITKYGFIFDGWYLNEKKYDFTTPVTKNITLVAKWKEDESIKRYEVTFDSDGGSKVDKQRVIENEQAKEPKIPTKTGYKFLGWYLNDKKYDFKSKVTDNIILKAEWEKIIQYTVTFNKDNGTPNETKLVNNGDKVSKPSDPKKSGYRFVEWLYENERFDFNTPIIGDITLTARYTLLPKYTVTFDSAGGSNVASQSISEGSKATKPANPTKDDSEFDGWYLNGNKYDFNTAVTRDITLVAKWKQAVYEYKMIATKKDNYSPDSVLKLYRNNSEVNFQSIIVDGKTINPHPSINTESLKGKLNGSKSIRVILTNGSEITATIEFR